MKLKISTNSSNIDRNLKLDVILLSVTAALLLRQCVRFASRARPITWPAVPLFFLVSDVAAKAHSPHHTIFGLCLHF